ncbi:class I SAM-dependent methyltransferase [Bacillus sp. SD088]|uniref:class I SAM-dependent methyltransferase n=1 Tax=Bacillus sp. SD088 TaxID=2782012 RepID=UPI001A974C45|nr:class I SAM-dependent methyltransferase [Bacillus sp. SD088]MBO0992448.1 class I SAM-dependent methyltransferase [Bacillus sp. SD088]
MGEYAKKLSSGANVKIDYIVSDIFNISIEKMRNSFDIVFMEFGILHYISDLDKFAKNSFDLLKNNGKLLLRDFHPFNKIVEINQTDGTLMFKGNYFDKDLQENPIAYEKFFSEKDREQFPKTYLRKWTFSEIITSFAQQGFVIKKMYEEPNQKHPYIPANYMIVAKKY